ncbi:MAG: glycyl radical protein [Bacteroidales bacterium]|nr:glycyl radical protein [Bacteroidales bacterium]
MNDRIKKLRTQSLSIKPSISTERAEFITEFYRNHDAANTSTPVRRALAFKYLMQNKEICINDGELIVGERGPKPKATPTYPEICLHSLEDLKIIDEREKVSFSVDEKTKEVYKNKIIPFWKGNSIRDRIFTEMNDDWKTAYEAGIFTEFQEQRAPGHTVLGDKIYKKGFLEIIQEINEKIDNLDFFNDPLALDKKEELTAMKIAAEALIIFAKRHSEKLYELAKNEIDFGKKLELEQLSEICKNVPAHKPKTFHESLQYYWFVHIGVISELNPWDSFNPGRLDQHLLPYYQKETAAGLLTKEKAIEYLQSFWIKFNNHPSPPKMGVTAKESNTYTDFALINLGGVKENGNDATNELTYLILDVIEEMRLLQPGSMVQISKKSPDHLLNRTLKILKTGFGQPSIFNTDAIIQELLRQGKSIEDARNGGASGCVETGAFGKEAYILTGYFNLPKILEITLNNGVDPRTQKNIGLETKQAKSFEELLDFFKKQLNYFADIKISGNNVIERIYGKYLPVPFLSILIDDCIKNGKDYNCGGAKYNTSYIQGVGIGSVSDELAALKFHVFENKKISYDEMMKVLKSNFENFDELRLDLLNNTPKYGNDDDYVDEITKKVFDIFYNAINGRPTSRGGKFRINLLPTTCHIYFGSVTGAMPDGRKAFTPLSEGISPVQGADTNGPTSVIKSASKIDHLKTGGTLLNQKFSPQLLKTESELNKLLHLIRSYFKMDGHHIQFNVITADTLRKAKKNPEQHKNLIVRVAGYSDYFNDLTKDLQDEIIRRTEHSDL